LKIHSQILLCAIVSLVAVPVAGLALDAYRYHQAAFSGPFLLSSDQADRKTRVRETILGLEKYLVTENRVSQIGAYLSSIGFDCSFLKINGAGEAEIEFVCRYYYSGTSIILYDILVIRMSFDAEYNLIKHEILVEVV
jgi:hypothetical protein